MERVDMTHKSPSTLQLLYGNGDSPPRRASFLPREPIASSQVPGRLPGHSPFLRFLLSKEQPDDEESRGERAVPVVFVPDYIHLATRG